MLKEPAILALEEGSLFHGYSLGVKGTAVGEIIFNTAMSGYQEIMTDPSYAHQMIVFSSPHIGNVGINTLDNESDRIWASGIIMSDCNLYPSNWRSEQTLPEFLIQQNKVGIAGIDTRHLIHLIRKKGTLKACIMSNTLDIQLALNTIYNFREISDEELIQKVTTLQKYHWKMGSGKSQVSHPYCSEKHFHHLHHHVVVYDFGVKRNILRLLVDRGSRVTVIPAKTSYQEVIKLQPDGIVLSNGPGNPANYQDIIENIRKLLEYDIPIFGICLGHQLLALAAGAKTFKMKFGHHGANHPVFNLKNKKVHISSQNHGFSVERSTLPATFESTFISLFDQTLQGIQHISKPFFSVQGHPEGSPGPHDMQFLFDQFIDLMDNR